MYQIALWDTEILLEYVITYIQAKQLLEQCILLPEDSSNESH